METLLMAKQENVDSETDSFPKAKGRENQDHAFDTHTHTRILSLTPHKGCDFKRGHFPSLLDP